MELCSDSAARTPLLQQCGLLVAGDGEDVEEQNDDHDSKDDTGRDHDLIDLVVLLCETRSLAVKATACSCFQFSETNTSLHNHCLVERLFGSGRRCVGLKTHLDLAEAQDLARFNSALGNLLAVYESPVGRIQIFDDHVISTQEHFSVMTGNRGFSDLEGIILHSTHRCFFRLQLVGSPSHSSAQKNEFRHKLRKCCRLSPAKDASQIETTPAQKPASLAPV